MMLGVGMIVAILPGRIIDFTGSGASVGYLASAFALSYLVLQVPIGNLSDRLGIKWFLLAGYMLCFSAGVLYYFSNGASLIFLGRIIQGAGEAPIWALAPALLSIKYPNSKGKVMGLYNASIHIGLTIGPLLGILVLKVWTGNQAFLFYALVCLLGAMITWFSIGQTVNNELDVKETVDFSKVIVLMSKGSTFAVLVGIMLYGAGYGIFVTNIPAFLIGVKEFDPTFIAVYFSLFYIGISLSQIIGGYLSDKMGREIFMIVGLLMTALGMALFPGLSQPFISVILSMASIGLGIFYIASMALLNELVPNSLKGTISGAYFLFWGIGYFFGPIIMGRLGELPGFSKGFYIFSIVLVLEAAVLMVFYRRAKSV
jgi:MFS family permease